MAHTKLVTNTPARQRTAARPATRQRRPIKQRLILTMLGLAILLLALGGWAAQRSGLRGESVAAPNTHLKRTRRLVRSMAAIFALTIISASVYALLVVAPAGAATPRVLAIHFGPDLEVNAVTKDYVNHQLSEAENAAVIEVDDWGQILGTGSGDVEFVPRAAGCQRGKNDARHTRRASMCVRRNAANLGRVAS